MYDTKPCWKYEENHGSTDIPVIIEWLGWNLLLQKLNVQFSRSFWRGLGGPRYDSIYSLGNRGVEKGPGWPRGTRDEEFFISFIFLHDFVSKQGFQNWLYLCIPIFHAYFWQSRWCEDSKPPPPFMNVFATYAKVETYFHFLKCIRQVKIFFFR